MTKTAAELCRYHQTELNPEGRALLRPGLSPQEFFERLLEKACYADARRVLAHALPKRRALWWGCLCAWDAYRPKPPETVSPALESVCRFVVNPSESNRRATEIAAAEAGIDTLAGCLAMAAFFSCGSVSRPQLPAVLPQLFVTGRLVSAGVYLASVTRDPAQYQECLRRYLTVGLEVARGKHLWTEREPVGATRELGEYAGIGALLQARELSIGRAPVPVEEQTLVVVG